jgi:two-component system, OmpR family, response regulator
MENADHILIVDDDRGIRELIAGYFEKNGMRVSLAANGREMRAALDYGAPDLIVLDLMLPGEDGLTLCRELRASKHRAVPVVMLTARNEETDRSSALKWAPTTIYRSRSRYASCSRAFARCCAAPGCCRLACR